MQKSRKLLLVSLVALLLLSMQPINAGVPKKFLNAVNDPNAHRIPVIAGAFIPGYTEYVSIEEIPIVWHGFTWTAEGFAGKDNIKNEFWSLNFRLWIDGGEIKNLNRFVDPFDSDGDGRFDFVSIIWYKIWEPGDFAIGQYEFHGEWYFNQNEVALADTITVIFF